MLCQPVKEFLEAKGYTVRTEVNERDMVAVQDETVLVVELKRTFNLSLVLQGVERQRSADYVFLAVEAPRSRGRRWTQISRLCRRLNLGLLSVTFPAKRKPSVELVCEPGEVTGVGASRVERSRLLKEFAGRSGDFNVGGSTGRPLVTAYREDALHIAYVLSLGEGPMLVKALREATGCERTGRILQDNYYRWFERVARGVYQLTEDGVKALEQYADVVQGWQGAADHVAAKGGA